VIGGTVTLHHPQLCILQWLMADMLNALGMLLNYNQHNGTLLMQSERQQPAQHPLHRVK
jgi:hypothetical protein